MTKDEFGRFIDEITDLIDRFRESASRGVPTDLGTTVQLANYRLASLEAALARALPGVELKGRAPTRRRSRSA